MIDLEKKMSSLMKNAEDPANQLDSEHTREDLRKMYSDIPVPVVE